MKILFCSIFHFWHNFLLMSKIGLLKRKTDITERRRPWLSRRERSNQWPKCLFWKFSSESQFWWSIYSVTWIWYSTTNAFYYWQHYALCLLLNTNEYLIVTIATLFKTLSGTPLNLHERDSTTLGKKVQERLTTAAATPRNWRGFVFFLFSAFFSLAYFSQLERICIVIVSQRRRASTSSLFLFSIATSLIVFFN